MKKLLISMLFLPAISFAGTISTSFSPLGTVTFSTGTAPITAVVFDASASSYTIGMAGNTSFNITIGSCDKRFLAVGCGIANAGTSDVTAMTVGGNSMTRSTGSIDGNAGTAIYTYINPPSGSQSIVVTFWGTTRPCAAASFCNVSQSAPIDFSTATYDYPTAGISTSTLTTTVLGDALFDVISGNDAIAPVPTQSGQAAIFSDGSFLTVGVSTRPAPTAGTYDMGWNNLAGFPHTTAAIAIKSTP